MDWPIGWGYRNYDCADAPPTSKPWVLDRRRELHNNHHTFGTSAKLSSKWYEFDIGWMYIRMMEIVGLAKVKKIAPEPKFDRRKLIADLDTLQSVIANRYDVMAKYAKSPEAHPGMTNRTGKEKPNWSRLSLSKGFTTGAGNLKPRRSSNFPNCSRTARRSRPCTRCAQNWV